MLYDLKDITYRYNSTFELNIDALQIKKGDMIGFSGPNGSGKSTLLMLMAFLETPSSGQLKYNNEIVHHSETQHYRQHVTMLFQNTKLLRRSVWENILYGLRIRDQHHNAHNDIEKILKLIDLPPAYLSRQWHELSGGESKRIALASRLIMKPEVLILDEPTAEIDPKSAHHIYNAITQYNEEYGTTFIISSHNKSWLTKTATTVYEIHSGCLKGIIRDNQLTSLPIEEAENNLVRMIIDEDQSILAYSPEKPYHTTPHILPDDILLSTHKVKDISAQNCLHGKINKMELVDAGRILVSITIGTLNIFAYISEQGARQLALTPGMYIFLIFKINSVKWM